jgi:hypothetical protein
MLFMQNLNVRWYVLTVAFSTSFNCNEFSISMPFMQMLLFQKRGSGLSSRM